jgi:hypothetical protein
MTPREECGITVVCGNRTWCSVPCSKGLLQGEEGKQKNKKNLVKRQAPADVAVVTELSSLSNLVTRESTGQSRKLRLTTVGDPPR